jgi:fibronectin-binding autotransporter adhesin
MRRSAALARRTLLLAGIVLAGTASTAWGASLSFTGEVSHDWNTAANWTDDADPAIHAVPGTGDDARIPSGAAAELNDGDPAVVRSVALEAGGSLSVTGRDLTVAGGAPSVLAGTLAATEATVRLAGEADWASGAWSLDAATVQNAGDLAITGDVSVSPAGDRALVLNTGTIRRDDADPETGTAAFGTLLVNDGRLAVDAGSADLLVGGATHSGAFTIAPGAVLAAGSDQALGVGATVGGEGTLRLDRGTFDVPAGAGDLAPGTLLLSGGILNLERSSTIPRLTSDGQGGGVHGRATLWAGGPTVLDKVDLASGTTNLSGPDVTIRDISMASARLNLEPGSHTLWDQGSWRLLGSRMHLGGDLLVTGDGSLENEGNGAFVLNDGTVTRRDADPATGTASFTAGFENEGLVNIEAGGLDLSGIAERAGGRFTVDDGATLSISGGQRLEPGGEVTGPGTLRLDADVFAVPQGRGRFDPGTILLSGGFLNLERATTVGRITSDGEGGGRFGSATLTGGGPTLLDNVVLFGGMTNLSGPDVVLRNLVLSAGDLTLLPGTHGLWDQGSWLLAFGTIANAGDLQITGDGTVSDGVEGFLRNSGSIVRDDADPTTGAATIAAPLVNTGTLHVVRGTLDPGSNAAQQAGVTSIDEGAVLGGPGARFLVAAGRLQGGGTFAGTLENALGTVAPGASPGTLTVDGAYLQGPGGTLEVEVAGEDPASGFDRLSVTGAASLAGRLAIVTAPGFQPPPGSSYDVVSAGALSGTFDVVDGAAVPGGHYDVDYANAPGGVRLHVAGAPPVPGSPGPLAG